jgi:hypothetical protein
LTRDLLFGSSVGKSNNKRERESSVVKDGAAY